MSADLNNLQINQFKQVTAIVVSADFSLQREAFSVTHDGARNSLLIFGGYCWTDDQQKVYLNDLLEYNLSTNQLVKLTV